jgi:EmrB/QacA subfamily drug resistance transporter
MSSQQASSQRASSPPSAQPGSSGHLVPPWVILVICCAAQFMVVLDVSIVNVALPSMQRDLGLSTTDLQWVVNAYTLTFAGLLLFGGRAADLFGRRRVFLLGLAVFTLASLVGGFADSGTTLILARAVQGVGAAILAPATLTLLTLTFRDPAERAKALGAWGAVAASGGAFGSFAGGLLTDLVSWRWVLFVNVPIGIVLFFCARWALTESKGQVSSVSELDVPGTVTVTLGLVALVWGIVQTDNHSWGSPQTVGALIVAAVLLSSFVMIEMRSANPLVPLGIFKRRAISVANGVVFLLGAGMFAFFFFATLYLQYVLGFSPLQAGVAFLPACGAIIIGAQVSARVVNKIGPRPLLLTGAPVAAVGLIWLSTMRANGTFVVDMLGPSMVIGLGMGLCMIASTIAATSGVEPQQAGLASGLLNTCRMVGAALGLAILNTIAASQFNKAIEAHPNLPKDALVQGYSHALFIGGLFMVAATLIGLLLPRVARVPAQPSGEPLTTAELAAESFGAEI